MGDVVLPHPLMCLKWRSGKMGKDSSEKYLDNLLNSMNGESGNSSLEMGKTEDEFLQMFENELESEKYNNYIADFEMELEAENNHDKNIDESAAIDNSEELSLDEVLANAENESGLVKKLEEDNIEDSTENENNDLDVAMEMFDSNTVSSDEDDFSFEVDTLEDGVIEEIGEAIQEPNLAMTEAGEPDLAGNADMSLEDMLGDGLSEIGDILSGDAENPQGDEFENFAKKEMGENLVSVGELDDSGENAPVKKKGLFARLAEMLFGSEDSEVDGVSSGQINGELANLSEENAQILMELEAIESDSKKKDKKAKKEKPKKEKKAKPKKEKPKKEKKPKPKKEKKTKVKDNTPPLPKGPVIMIWIMAGSMLLFVLLCTNLMGYQVNVNQAKTMYTEGQYIEAFKKIEGIDVKEADQSMYDKLRILSSVSSEIEAYKSFYSYDKQLMAFDSLICAAGRYVTYEEDAKTLGCEQELGALKESIETELTDKYKMTFDEATELYNAKDRKAYTVAIYKKLAQLGIAVE